MDRESHRRWEETGRVQVGGWSAWSLYSRDEGGGSSQLLKAFFLRRGKELTKKDQTGSRGRKDKKEGSRGLEGFA